MTPGLRKLKKLASDAGVGIASVLPVLRWSGPDEDQRQAAVRAWKRVIQITVDLGVDVINSEFNGRPEAPETAEAQFLKSMDELLPIFEREGVQLIIEPHPDDFIEDGLEALNLIRGLNRDWLGFLYCTPHAFHQGNDPATIIEAAGDKVRYVHLADAWNHLTSNGLRYITNPPGNPARVHQHMEMGMGEVDYDLVFAALAAVEFDGVISSCVFGWEEDARVGEMSCQFPDILLRRAIGEMGEKRMQRSELAHVSPGARGDIRMHATEGLAALFVAPQPFHELPPFAGHGTDIGRYLFIQSHLANR